MTPEFHPTKITVDYINEVLHEGAEDDQKQTNSSTIVNPADDWDDGLTFTARTSRKYSLHVYFVSVKI